MFRYVITGLFVYLFLSLINSSNSQSSSRVLSLFSLFPEICSPLVGVVGLLCNSVDGKVAFIDDKLDELLMLLFDSQFCVKYVK